MPRDGSGIYSQPFPDVVAGTTIESAKYNGNVNDVEQDLNTPRPIVAGGTGASSAVAARSSLGVEAARQPITNYDGFPLMESGSFYSAPGATSAPNATNRFAGIYYCNADNSYGTMEARDQTTGILYTKNRLAGVWDATWTVDGSSYAAPFDALAYNGMQVNGAMEISQENAAAAVLFPAGSEQKYVVDSWQVYKTGTNAFNVQQVASVFPGYNKALKLTVTTAQASIGADAVYLDAMIEGYRFARAQWGLASAQPITVGFWVKSSVAGNMVVQCLNTPETIGVNASLNILAANTAQWMTATFAGNTSAVWQTGIGLGLRLRFFLAQSGSINIAATNGNTFEITGLVVLPGIEAPSAERSAMIMRPGDQELVLCQRYYTNSYTPGTPVGAASANSYIAMVVASTLTQLYGNLNFPGPMRASPTMRMWSYAGTLGGWSHITGANVGGSGLLNASERGINSGSISGVSPSAGAILICHYEANARL